MKKLLLPIMLLIALAPGLAQDGEAQRLQTIKNQLTILSADNSGFTENVKTDISISNITLANFLLAVSDVHKVNFNVSPELNSITIAPNFSNVSVADLLVYLCKEYELSIDFTGNILSIKKYQKPQKEPEERIIPIAYNPSNNTVSIDAKGDKLYEVFKTIMDKTGKNLVFSPGLENKTLTAYIQVTPFDAAMENLAFANDLFMERTKDGFYVFEDNSSTIVQNPNNPNAQRPAQRPTRRRSSNFFFKVLDQENKVLEVDFVNTSIANIINDIGNELKIDVFTATPLDNAGVASFKAKSIEFDDLLVKLFEVQNNTPSGNVSGNTVNQNRTNTNQAQVASSTEFTYKKEGNIYFFGTADQLSVRQVDIIPLMYRSIELLSDPQGGGQRTSSRQGGFSRGGSNAYGNNSLNQFDNNINRNQQPSNQNFSRNQSSLDTNQENILGIVPDEIKQGLDIKVDYELNSFYVNGPSANIIRFKEFITQIDKPVPVILIEVMIIEVSRSATVETGIEWGLGTEPTETQGAIFPETNLTLGAQTINKVIGGFDGIGSFKVVPNFFASIKAMETNGDLKIRSTPKITTLNGHRATLSNGQTSYYSVTQRNIYGTDNPQTSEITNYYPIDAELGITIKPTVAGDGQVTLDIFVIQSSFGSRIASDAPPDLNAREFSSIVRLKDQDIAVLGGLEEQVKRGSSSGVPLLARIPVIKWLFSKRKREGSKSKLTVLLKPTVYY